MMNVLQIEKKIRYHRGSQKGLLKSINKKNKLYKLYLKSPTNENLQKFKTYKNNLNMLIKSKRMYYFRKLDKAKNNMKETWNEINFIIGKEKRKSRNCKFRDDDGNYYCFSRYL